MPSSDTWNYTVQNDNTIIITGTTIEAIDLGPNLTIPSHIDSKLGNFHWG